jgi:hypothetical protein
MDGSTTAIIVIPIVTTLSLALWIFLVYWADAHPRNDADAHPRNRGRDETLTASPGITTTAPAHDIPAPRPSPDDVPGSRQVRPPRTGGYPGTGTTRWPQNAEPGESLPRETRREARRLDPR